MPIVPPGPVLDVDAVGHDRIIVVAVSRCAGEASRIQKGPAQVTPSAFSLPRPQQPPAHHTQPASIFFTLSRAHNLGSQFLGWGVVQHKQGHSFRPAETCFNIAPCRLAPPCTCHYLYQPSRSYMLPSSLPTRTSMAFILQIPLAHSSTEYSCMT